MPYDDFLPDSAPELPAQFTVSAPPADALPTKVSVREPKRGFRPPHRTGHCRIKGVIRSRWRLPLPHAEVSLYHALDRRHALSTTQSDHRGAFCFSRLAPGEYRVVARKNHRKSEKKIRLTASDCRKEITLTLA